jgi:peptidyl-prolyl cis-trans isomerase SurA
MRRRFGISWTRTRSSLKGLLRQPARPVTRPTAGVVDVEKGATSFMMPRSPGVFAATVIAATLMGAPFACAAAPTPPPAPAPAKPAAPDLREGVAAIVNDSVISTYDLSQRVRLLLVTSGVRPTQDNLPEIEREALRSLVDERLETDEIKREEKEQKFKIMADDSEVDQEVDRLAQSSGLSRQQLTSALAAAGVGTATLRDQLRVQISWERWIQGRYGGSRLKISPDRISAVIRDIEADASKPQYLVSEIYIEAARAGGIDAATADARQIIAQLQQGAPFASVAQQFSGSTTAANGGDAGWLSASQLPEGVGAAVETMRPGALSQPVVSHDGVYIILLRDKRSGAGSDLVTLKQAAISLPPDAPADQVDAAQAKLLALKSHVTGCDSLSSEAAKVQGVVAGDLGEADVNDLAPAFKDAAEKLKVGEISDPLRTKAGLHLIALCGKRMSGVNLPPREEIEARLQSEQLSLVSRRYLRDLRNSATIETR